MLKLDTKTYWSIVILCLIAFCEVKGQFFNQDFESSTTVADYSAGTPSRWQVDHIGSNNLTISHETNPNRLRFQRSNNNGQAAYARTTDIAGSGSGLNALMVRFDILGFDFPATAREVMVLQLGNGFNNNNAAEGAGKIFAEVSLHSTTTADRFQVGNAGTATGSISTADNARITVAANKSGTDVFYIGPDGNSYTLPTGRMDVWLGNTREVSGADISSTSEASVTNFKFRFDYGLLNPARIELDDISLFPLYAAGGGMSGNYSVGRGTLAAHTSQFTSLTRNGGGFFEVLNFSNPIAGPINFQVMTDISVENGANALNQLTGMSAANPIEIQPDGTTMRTVSGNVNNANGMIRLNGADYVVFDGRAPAVSSVVPLNQRYLTFRNTNTGGPTFHLRSDASHNALQYSIIEGRDTDGSRAVVMFGNGTVTGNDHNLVEYCDVKDDAGNTPRNGIFSSGTSVAVSNDLNRIENCNLYNIFNDNSHPAFILINNHSNYWTISGNSFYHTVTRTYGNNRRYSLLYVNTGVGHTIINNFFGGSNATATGTMNLQTNNANNYTRLWAVWLNVGTSESSLFSGNTIQNISITSQGNDTTMQEMFNGIRLTRGNIMVTNNIIKNISIQATSTTPPNSVGINISGTETSGSVSSNTIEELTLSVSGMMNNATHYGVQTTSTTNGILAISGNIIRNLQTSSLLNINFNIAAVRIGNSGPSTSLIVDGNFIYGLDESITMANPLIAGIRIDTYSNAITLSNNMISLGVGNTKNIRYVGILNNTSNTARLNVVYNTVYLGGNVMMGMEDTYCFYRGNNSTTPVFVYNNVFHNARTNEMMATGRHFAIGSDVTTNWGENFTDCESTKNFINYNAYYVAAPALMARLAGTNYGFAGWQGLGFEAKGVNLNPSGPIAFTNVATAQLYKSSPAELRLNGKAYPLLPTSVSPDLPTVTNDIDDEPRIGPDLGADEDLVNFTATTDGTWGDPATWGSTVIPSYGDIVNIPAGISVTVPTGVDQYYYRLNVAGTLELQGAARVFGCFSDAFGGATALAATGNIQMDPASLLGLASSLTDLSGQPLNGTVDFNMDAVPPPLTCYLSDYIEALNAETNTVSLLGSAPNTTIQNINLLNTGILALEKQLTTGIDANGVLNLNNGQMGLNGGRLLIAGDLAESAGTFSGGPAAALSIIGTGDLTGTLKVDTLGLQELVLNRTGKGVVALGQDLIVTQNLVLTEGILATDNFLVNARDAAVSSTADGYVMGRLRRHVVAGTPIAFPVGSVLNRNQATVTFTGLEGLQWVTASFDPDYAGANITPITDNGIEYVQACQGGRWTLIPNVYVPAVYNLALEGTDVGCLGSAQTIAKISGTTADFAGSVHGTANSRTGFTGFTSFVFLSDFVPLPLTLLQFSARWASPAVRVAWETAAERGISYYAVERATDGWNFTEIARLDAQNQHGTHGYEHFDATWKAFPHTPNVLYYRLRYLDEGVTRYTQVVSVGLQQAPTSLSVFPNPSQGELYVALGTPVQWVNIHLMDLAGKTLSKESFVQPGEQLAIPGFQQLPKGVYLVVVQSPSGRQTCKIVRE